MILTVRILCAVRNGETVPGRTRQVRVAVRVHSDRSTVRKISKELHELNGRINDQRLSGIIRGELKTEAAGAEQLVSARNGNAAISDLLINPRRDLPQFRT